MKPMEIVETRWGPALVLACKGTLDIHTSPPAQDKLLSLIDQGYNHLALDFSELESISSAGLRVLLTVLKKSKSVNGKVVIFGFKKYVKGIFEIAGFTALFPMYHTAEEALGAFQWTHPLARFVRAPRQGPNAGAYFGETIDIDALQLETLEAAQRLGWTCEPFWDEAGCRLFALSRLSSTATRTFYLSSGIHGDEPAPPLAVLKLLQENRFPMDWNIYLCPCLNPQGFRQNQRASAEGIDLNRDYFKSKSKQIRAHVAWLEKQAPFSLAVSLHEDWEAAGFYVYQLGPLSVEPVIRHIIDAVAKVCTIDHSSTIDHLPAEQGALDLAFHSLQVNEKLIDELDVPSTDSGRFQRADCIWSEPIFLVNRKTRVSYTFESASAFPLEVRVEAMTQAVNALLSCPHEIY
jgi:anti-anti-sigma factor